MEYRAVFRPPRQAARNPARGPAAAGAGTSPDGTPWRVAVVEDHLLQRQRAVQVLEEQPGLTVVFSGETFPEFLDWHREAPPAAKPHLLLLDLVVERGPCVDPVMVRLLVRQGLRVLVFSELSSVPLVRQVLRAGVGGFVSKRDPVDDVVGAVWTVLGRGTWMTPELAAVIAGDSNRPVLSDQEERALVLYASGKTLAAVAEELGVKRDTAKTYLERVKAKYLAVGRPVRTKVDLSRVAVADGYADPA